MSFFMLSPIVNISISADGIIKCDNTINQFRVVCEPNVSFNNPCENCPVFERIKEAGCSPPITKEDVAKVYNNKAYVYKAKT